MTASFDWHRALRKGEVMAVDEAKVGARLGPEDVMWALFKDACRVSRSYSSPPRSGYPVKSCLPEAPSDLSMWQRIMAYLQGEVSELPGDQVAMVRPSAEEISRSEAVLFVWHHHALMKKGKRKMLRKAVFALACGAPYRAIRERTGIARASLYRAKDEAMRDMWAGVKDVAKLR